ncbi:hypothetical protein Pmani_025441 [Petrolisthes manimaculis]|uniref:HMG box domain-containing protein n=1 Tax=Petrolisthes manimaculis TaxID=1843537 RepID=A0AAE1P5K0_9EUCA|nr:hypothetical protein Pmani_025441 [Petrolisthes manimaculis]
MEGAEDTTLLLDDVEGPKTLLVYCGAEEEQHEAQVQDKTRRDLQLEADLDLHLPLSLDNDEEDALWLVGNTLQLGMANSEDSSEGTLLLGGSEVLTKEGGSLLEEQENETLLLLSEEVSLLPFTQELPVTQDTIMPVSPASKEGGPKTVVSEPFQIKVVDRSEAKSHQLSQCENSLHKPPARAICTVSTPTPSLSKTPHCMSPSIPTLSSGLHTVTTPVPTPRTYSRANTCKTSKTTSTQASSTAATFKDQCLDIRITQNLNIDNQNPDIQKAQKSEANALILSQRKKGQHSYGVKVKLATCSKSSIDEDELSEEPFVGPSVRWPTQPKSYRGAKARDGGVFRKTIRKVPPRVDTDGETSGMGSSVDEPVESSTESASEATPTPAPSFLQPRTNSSSTSSPRSLTTSPTAVKKRRGGWPKGRKRKPELPVVKPPKAPLTAYVLFLNERRKYYKETRPDLRFGAVTKLLGAEWSSLTAEQKAAFVTRSEQDKRRYRNELQAYRQSHDYQLLLRKKRIKNVIRRGGTTTEESSDFTDEIDDDDSEELYCRICDQLFTSLHNKREHLYGKQHLQAITGEYQRERLAEEERQMAAAMASGVVGSVAGVGRDGRVGGSCLCKTSGAHNTQAPRTDVLRLPGVCSACCSTPRAPRTQDEDHDGDEEDEEEEDEEEEEEEDEEKEAALTPVRSMSSMADTLEGVMAKVLEREKEIASLEGSREAARARNLQLASGLLRLRERSQGIESHRAQLKVENTQLKAEADVLWMLPALFGVTPLQMVDITLREQQQEQSTADDQEEDEDHVQQEGTKHEQWEPVGQWQQGRVKQNQWQKGKTEELQLWETEGQQQQTELWDSKLEETNDQLEEVSCFTEQVDLWEGDLEEKKQQELQQQLQHETEEPNWDLQEIWEEQVGGQILVGQVEQGEEEKNTGTLITLQQEDQPEWQQEEVREEEAEVQQDKVEHDLLSLLGDT